LIENIFKKYFWQEEMDDDHPETIRRKNILKDLEDEIATEDKRHEKSEAT
jgi:hypothetical protein